MTLGVENSQSGSHVTVIIWNFILVSLTSTATPYPIGLPFRITMFFHPTHLTTYPTPYCLCNQKVFPAMRTIYIWSTC